MQAKQGARGFPTGRLLLVNEQGKRSATTFCDAYMRLLNHTCFNTFYKSTVGNNILNERREGLRFKAFARRLVIDDAVIQIGFHDIPF